MAYSLCRTTWLCSDYEKEKNEFDLSRYEEDHFGELIKNERLLGCIVPQAARRWAYISECVKLYTMAKGQTNMECGWCLDMHQQSTTTLLRSPF